MVERLKCLYTTTQTLPHIHKHTLTKTHTHTHTAKWTCSQCRKWSLCSNNPTGEAAAHLAQHHMENSGTQEAKAYSLAEGFGKMEKGTRTAWTSSTEGKGEEGETDKGENSTHSPRPEPLFRGKAFGRDCFSATSSRLQRTMAKVDRRPCLLW